MESSTERRVASQTVTALLELLEVGDFQERWDAAKRLPSFGEPALEGTLVLLRSHPEDDELAWFAAQVIGQFHSSQALSALLELLRNEATDKDVKGMAARTLANLGAVAIAPLSELLQEERWRLLGIRTLAQIRHGDVSQRVAPFWDDDNPEVRAQVLALLGCHRHQRLLTPLLKGLRDLSPLVRREATIALGLQHEWVQELAPEVVVVGLLQERLLDLDVAVSQQAAIALSRVGTLEAIAALGRCLRSPQTPVPLNLEVIRALGWIERPQSIELLQTALSLPSLQLCLEAIRVLSQVKRKSLKPRAAKALTTWWNRHPPQRETPQVRQAIALGLGNFQQPETEAVVRSLLEDADETVRWHAQAGCEAMG
ncbi:HEAT repeat domain-containing protein [Phormidium yuhuli AB48]|uniref:HEAT repeat domain-containing protein n=1 Tax=Phormidium yuhuli AB48 TaxID=2940671 RepID=A0ABY5ASA0_9CYAN|nr:HEAT repeat domain-containing protein [Phormidium yuhuli]USR91008.1 HEAT repeat domain-containing protein [Phormidium yuhuli AB48]